MEELLPQLKKPVRRAVTKVTDQKEIFFRLCFDEKGAFVEVVNKNMKPALVDYHAYGGDVFNVLRSLAIIKEKRTNQFSWKDEAPHIYLSDHTSLIYQLIRCNNLCDRRGHAISVSSLVAVPGMALTTEDNKISSHFFLNTEEGENDMFYFLSDSFVLANLVIYPIEPLGDNYAQLPLFKTTFSQNLLETFLSVFFSYFNNMDLRYEDYTIERSDSEIKTVPMLIIEKVDSDKCIYMHLDSCLPDNHLQETDRFDLTQQATLTADRKIVVKPIIREPLELIAARLKMTIQSFSPDIQAKKDVFRKGNFFIISPETAAPFLANTFPSLQNEFILIGTEHLSVYK